MASISKRLTAAGAPRYDVRYRAGGRAVEETFKRRQDAENRVRQVEAEKLTGPVADLRRGREKLADFADRWLDTRLVKGKPLAPMTRQGYLGLLARNIDATIGQYKLARITPSVVRDWYSKVSRNAGRDEAAKSYRLLRAILNTAVDDELIVRNPCRIRGGGAERADERPMIDSALVFRLADSISARLRALVIVAGFVGLRTGELLGLRRCDLDLETARLTVLVQAQQVIGQGRIVTGPKSEAGQRTVSLPKAVVETLEKHLASNGQPGEAGVLITGLRGEPITRALLSSEWQAARTTADAPEGLRIHDLRHHAATLTARMPARSSRASTTLVGLWSRTSSTKRMSSMLPAGDIALPPKAGTRASSTLARLTGRLLKRCSAPTRSLATSQSGRTAILCCSQPMRWRSSSGNAGHPSDPLGSTAGCTAPDLRASLD